MSDPQNRFTFAVEDPPLLRALLLVAGNDQEARSEITRAYHACLEGAKASPFVMSSVLLSAIGAAILRSAADANGNGTHPGQLKSPQLETIALSLKALPGRDEVATKQDLQTLQSGIRALQGGGGDRAKQLDPEVRRLLEDVDFNTKESLNLLRSGSVGQARNPFKRWVKNLGFLAAAAIIGWLACFMNLQSQVAEARREAAQRMERIVTSQPFENRFTSALWAKGGGTPTIETITVDGHDAQGIVIPPGTLKYGAPFIANAGKPGAAVIPIQ